MVLSREVAAHTEALHGPPLWPAKGAHGAAHCGAHTEKIIGWQHLQVAATPTLR